ncbi:MAG: glycosyltransferase [Promethearchaeota archaeon]
MSKLHFLIYGTIIIGIFAVIYWFFPREWSLWLIRTDQLFNGTRLQFLGLFIFGAVLFVIFPLLYGISFLASFGNVKFPKGSENFFPNLSIIIPALNEAKIIGETLKSFILSKYPKDKLELLVVVSGSTDETEEICLKYQDQLNIKILNDPQPKKGKPAALNIGLKYASYDIICIYDADNHIREDTLQNLVRPLYNPEIDAVQGAITLRNLKDNLMTKALLLDYTYLVGAGTFHQIRDRLGRGLWLLGRNYCIRKKVLEEFGGWKEDALTEDLHLSVQLAASKKKIRHASKAICDEKAPTTWIAYKKQRQRWVAGYRQDMEAAMELDKRYVIRRNLTMLHYGHKSDFALASLVPALIFGLIMKDFFLMVICLTFFGFCFGISVNSLRKYGNGHYRYLLLYPLYAILVFYMFTCQFKKWEQFQWDKTEK